ncbi:GrpB family protein [Rhizobium sp. BK251]|uniref:GrpB family protein n=1 Tax=Rhizobium sp. BK251 TaxID=2512125 RepID=UPI00104CEE1D|nr:GrpB family protein [Rhizobium sp. BK251]TCL70244.1 GrpB-like predicted nucleotidyltransferase (UPF0157 family) [Rhizobium sp. BK251]
MEDDASFGLGLKHKSVRLAEPNDRWREAFSREEIAIRQVLGTIALDVQHFGSTAIPAIRAKPIIDILVGVRHFDDGLACVAPLGAIGYDYAGSDIVPGDHIFGRGIKGETRTHLVHIVEHGGFHWQRNILFRDRLRNDPSLARSYEELKIQLAQAHVNDRAAYTEAKKAFIDKVVMQEDASR